jgi:phage-related protein (TIGR01555 family)
MVTNFDSQGLNQIFSSFSSISNPLTGIGTIRDKSKTLSINGVRRLSKSSLESLPRTSGMIRNLVEAYPTECRKDWMKIKQIRLENQQEYPVGELEKYLENLKNKIGKIGIKEAFTKASIIGRQHGDGFIILGIADGKDPKEPVEENSIQAIEWLKVLNCYEIYPKSQDGKYDIPEYYTVYKSGLENLWHASRILRFSGKKNYDDTLNYRGGYHDSVIQSMFDTWSAWQTGLMSGSAMLADYNQAKYKMKGLGQALKEDLRAGTNTRQEQIRQRLYTAEMGRSVLKALLVDMDEEDFDYVSRAYGGASEIMGLLKDALISEVDLPSYKFFNTTNATGSALGTAQTAGLAQRYDWVGHKNNWMDNNWVEPYEKILRYAMAAKDFTAIPQPVEIEIIPNAKVQLTPLEKIEAQLQATQRDAVNIELGIYSPISAQNAYKEGEWDGQIHLAQEDLL